MNVDHYATLGVDERASAATIRRARRRLLRIHHPDASNERRPLAEARTRAILVASATLLDPQARAEYDAMRHSRRPHGTAVAATGVARDLACAACGRLNVRTTRHACLFCGEGIGDTPCPIPRSPLPRELAVRSRNLDLAAGAFVGFFIGASAFAFGLVDPILLSSCVLLGAAIGALVGSVLGDRIMDVLSDIADSR